MACNAGHHAGWVAPEDKGAVRLRPKAHAKHARACINRKLIALRRQWPRRFDSVSAGPRPRPPNQAAARPAQTVPAKIHHAVAPPWSQ